MPAFSAPLLGFALGAGLFWSVARQLSRPIRPVAGHAVLIAAALGLTVYAPAVALLTSAEPDWAFAYVVPASRLPRWLVPALVLCAGMSVPLGFALASRAYRRRASFGQAWFWLPLGLGVAPLVALSRRLADQASFEQYQGDFGIQPLVGGPLGYLLMWVLVALAVALALTRRCLEFLVLGGKDGS
jgi:hypothetical protein